MASIKTALTAACRRAGIEDSRFHDLTHTFASHMAMRGASLKEVQEVLGHHSLTMTIRYTPLSQEHKKQAVNLTNGLTAPRTPANVTCHKTVTSLKPAESAAL
jgi:site-specific recombinase XerD